MQRALDGKPYRKLGLEDTTPSGLKELRQPLGARPPSREALQIALIFYPTKIKTLHRANVGKS